MKTSLARLAFAIVFLAAASYAFITLRGPRGIPGLLERQQQIRGMEKRNADLDQEIERIRERINRLQNNPSQQELEVRERLKLVKPGEKVYITGTPAK